MCRWLPLALTLAACANEPPATSTTTAIDSTAPTVQRVLAGEVTTLATKADGAMDGLAVHPDGTIYASSNLTNAGFEMVQISQTGQISTFVPDLPFPLGIAIHDDQIYVACWNDGAIHGISPTGQDSVYSQGSSPPSDVAFGPDGTLYIANFEANSIDRIEPGGTRETFSTSGRYNHPHGLSIADDGTLYVGNYSDGRIFRVEPDGSVERIATIPSEILGYMTWLEGDLYATGASTHIVYQIGMDGVVTPFAGSGTEGSEDGPALEAKLTPNGITGDPDRRVLYVSESTGKLRVIPLL